MEAYDIDPGVAAAVAGFRLPERLGFGQISAPVMFDADWRDGAWQRASDLLGDALGNLGERTAKMRGRDIEQRRYRRREET